MCMHMCVHMPHVYCVHGGQMRASHLLGLECQVVVRHLTWVLGAKLGSFGTATLLTTGPSLQAPGIFSILF